MGIFDKLKEKGRGIVSAAKPQEGVAPSSEQDVRAALHAISGPGIQVGDDEDEVVVSWSAKVASAGFDGGEYEHLYRAIRVEFDAKDSEAKGVCYKTTTEAALGDSLTGSKKWERGQHVGSETVHVIAWLGPHHVEGGATEEGYKFSWSDLREPVMDAVTGAGWTYKPKRV
jgi:hypothetical protein